MHQLKSLVAIFCSIVVCQASIDHVLQENEGIPPPDATQGANRIDHVTVEVDMVFSEKDWRIIEESQGIVFDDYTNHLDEDPRKTRSALKSTKRYWTDATIPYEILDGDFTTGDVNTIEDAIDELEAHTCLRFTPTWRGSNRNMVVFRNGTRCTSYVGMQGGEQDVTLTPGCRTRPVLLHLLGHALGRLHEHTRPDRDQYITIARENIDPRQYFNLQRYTWNVVEDTQVRYDYESIMHFGKKAFSGNELSTIVTKDPRKQNIIGNAVGLSFFDITVLNKIYGCSEKCGEKECNADDSFLGADCECYCPGEPAVICPATTTTKATTKQVTFAVPEATTTGAASTTTMSTTTTTPTSTSAKTTTTQTTPTPTITTTSPTITTATSTHTTSTTTQKTTTTTTMIPTTTSAVTYPSTTPPECVDLNTMCTYWAPVGHCKSWRWRRYMKKNCKTSCGLCNPPTTTTRTTRPTTTTTPTTAATTSTTTTFATTAFCIDRSFSCQNRASQGHCTTLANRYRRYMERNCKLTCGFCHLATTTPTTPPSTTMTITTNPTTTDADCSDLSASCGGWAILGYCSKRHVYRSFMEESCRLSCKFCKQGTSTTATTTTPTTTSITTTEDTTAECSDLSFFCYNWESVGHCTTQTYYYRNYMEANCRLTCGLCDAGTPTPSTTTSTTITTSTTMTQEPFQVCRDNGPGSCWILKSLGRCTQRQHRAEMRRRCARTCEFCQPCEDKKWQCRRWAERGECVMSPVYMRMHCRLSCGECAEDEGQVPSHGCMNQTPSCNQWGRDQCLTRPLMRRTCPLTCGVCELE